MNNTCTFMKNLRVLNNLTQEELSQRIGITASAYSHFETGIRQPDINTLVKLCCFYKINIMHLIYLVCMDMCPTEDQAPEYSRYSPTEASVPQMRILLSQNSDGLILIISKTPCFSLPLPRSLKMRIIKYPPVDLI